KRSRDDVLAASGKEAQRGQITDTNANGAGTTYPLEVEREHNGSDHGCNCRGSGDDGQAGGGEGAQRVRSRMQRKGRAGRRAGGRWRERTTGQITDATAEGAGTTYGLEVERENNGSDHGCNCRGSGDDVQTGGGEGAQRVRSRMQ